jgi:DNA modification methylase
MCNAAESGANWTLYNGDCCEVTAELPESSIDFTVFSPPFSSLYVYSDSERDMGNCETDEEFWQHFNYLIAELFRVTKPGRLVAVHCMQLPALKSKDGFIGVKDFRGDIIRNFQNEGFIYHSEICIWKDPVVAMQRTKSVRLLNKQLLKDSAMSGQSLADYVCVFRKDGVNAEPIAGPIDGFVGDDETAKKIKTPIDIWQRYASPVWMDIDQGRVLKSYREGRDEKDERHICPLQLDVIERCVQLWSNPGDIVFSPFAGIGSEGHGAIQQGRKFIGIELKPEYFSVACRNLAAAENANKQRSLFDMEPAE